MSKPTTSLPAIGTVIYGLKLLTLMICLLATLFVVPAAAQSAAEWKALKQKYGLAPSLTYQEWVKQGCPIPNQANKIPSSGGRANSALPRPLPAQTAQKVEAAQKQRVAEANRLKQQGIDAYNSGDCETALQYFRAAELKTPDDSSLVEYIQNAQSQITAKNQREREKQQQEERDAFMQQRGLSLRDFAQDFKDPDGRQASALKGTGSTDLGLKTAAKSSDAFGLKTSSASSPSVITDSTDLGLKTATESGGAFRLKTSSASSPSVITDSRVVDARNVPSGLPKFVDNAILAAYGSAPPGVSDRVRKGFQAAVNHDWKLARAWFGDALNHAPGNPGLKRLVDLADYTEKRIERGNTGTANDASSARKPTPLPFPGLTAAEARRFNDYVFDQVIKATESDDFRLKPGPGSGHDETKIRGN